MKNKQIKIAGIVKNSIVDGPGIRYTIFGQGCSLKCEDCHNPQTHNPSGGELMYITKIAEEIKKDPLLDGVTFTGGEPFAQIEEFAELAKLIKTNSELNIICYTGYSFNELYSNPKTHILLKIIDVLIDGRFEKNHKDYKLRFKGSKNQRFLDSKESIKCGKPIEITL